MGSRTELERTKRIRPPPRIAILSAEARPKPLLPATTRATFHVLHSVSP